MKRFFFLLFFLLCGLSVNGAGVSYFGTFTGNAGGLTNIPGANIVGTATNNTTGTAANVTGVVAPTNGGTGNANGAFIGNMVLPSVYSLSFTNGLIRYLDATNGSDTNNGTTFTLAKKNPDAMFTNGIGVTGYTYIWAEGTYKQGTNNGYSFTNVAFIADPNTHWSCTNTNGVLVNTMFNFITNCYLQGGVFDFNTPENDPLPVTVGGNFIFKNNVIHGSQDAMYPGNIPFGTCWEIGCYWESSADVCLFHGTSASASVVNVVNSVNISHVAPDYGQSTALNCSSVTVNSFGSVFQVFGASGNLGNVAVTELNGTVVNLWNTVLEASATDNSGSLLAEDDGSGTLNVWGHSYPELLLDVNTVNQNMTAGATFPAGGLLLLDTYGNAYWASNVDIPGTLTVGAATNTATGTLIQTNFVSGKLYTNIYGRPISVSLNATLTITGVSGQAQASLLMSGYLTNSVIENTGAGTAASTNTFMLNGVVPAGQSYTPTNLSAGTGDSATFSGGQILVQ